MSEQLERLERLIVRLENCSVWRQGRKLHPLEQQHAAKAEAIKKKHFKRKKEVTYEELMTVEEFKVFDTEIRKKVERVSAQVKKWQEKLDAEITELVSQMGPPQVDAMSKLHSVSDYNYSSQPRAREYAKVGAELYAERMSRQGLTTHVREVRQSSPTSRYVRYDFEIWVNTTPKVGKRIAEAYMLPLRDTLKFILQRGCNVRVYFPMLPYETEAQLGIDAWGNDVKVKDDGQTEKVG